MSNADHDDSYDTATGEILPPVSGQALSEISAQISQQVATARAFPRRRDIDIAKTIEMRSTMDEETAAECVYTVPRGGKDQTGPSIRFAEIVFQAWGNNRVFGYVTDVDRAAMVLTAQGIHLDLETNSAVGKSVQRGIATSGKGGKKPRLFSEDMIVTTGNAAIAIAMREAILRGIPRAVWRRGYLAVMTVLQGDAKTLGARRSKALAAFKAQGVEPGQVFAELGIKDENDITIEMMPTLLGLFNALKAGDRKPESFGRPAAGEPAHPVVANPLSDTPPEPDGTLAQPGGPAAKASTGAETAPTAGNAPAATAEATGARVAETQQPKPEKDAAPPKEPAAISNGDYVASATAHIAKQTSASAIDDWWKRERTARVERKLTAEQLEEMADAKDARLRELRK